MSKLQYNSHRSGSYLELGKLQLALADCVFVINHMITTLKLSEDLPTKEYPYPLNQLFNKKGYDEIDDIVVC